MSVNMYTRTEMLIGNKNMNRLKNSRVLIFGLGGVGSYAAEAIVRAGVGHVSLVDFDDVDITNINRQIPALGSTVGSYKVDILKERYLDINPNLDIDIYKVLLNSDTIDNFDLKSFDYVIDAIDMVESKVLLIESCYRLGVNIISSMGMGFRLDPSYIKITDIYKTCNDPLARVIRKKLRDRKVKKLKVVYSDELPIKGTKDTDGITASISFVPSAAGLIMASAVVNDLINISDV